MNTNSLLAHSNNLELGNYKKMADKILFAISVLGEATIQKVSDFLGTSPHKISGRFRPLVEGGKLEIVRNEKVGRNNFGIYKVKQ